MDLGALESRLELCTLQSNQAEPNEIEGIAQQTMSDTVAIARPGHPWSPASGAWPPDHPTHPLVPSPRRAAALIFLVSSPFRLCIFLSDSLLSTDPSPTAAHQPRQHGRIRRLPHQGQSQPSPLAAGSGGHPLLRSGHTTCTTVYLAPNGPRVPMLTSCAGPQHHRLRRVPRIRGIHGRRPQRWIQPAQRECRRPHGCPLSGEVEGHAMM